MKSLSRERSKKTPDRADNQHEYNDKVRTCITGGAGVEVGCKKPLEEATPEARLEQFK